MVLKYDVISVGSATVDVFAMTQADMISITNSNCKTELIAYPIGQKIIIEKLHFYVGGGGTNTAVTFARAGLKTAYLGSLGEDENLPKIMTCLRQEKIDFIGSLTSVKNDYSVVLDSQHDDRTILNYKCASEKLRFKKINKDRLYADWFYFSSFTNDAFKEAQKIAKHAKKKGSKIAFNPSSYLTKKGIKYLTNMIKLTDVLILNEEEAEMLTDKVPNLWKMKKLKSLGPKIVAITKGKNGVDVLFNNTLYVAEIYKTKVQETTGAGDAFASAFIAALKKSTYDIEFAIKMGLANSASVVSHIGPKNDILTYHEAKTYIEKKKLIMHKHKL